MYGVDLQSLQTTEVEKAPKGAPPAGNVWEKRQKDRDTDHPEIETTTSEGNRFLQLTFFYKPSPLILSLR